MLGTNDVKRRYSLFAQEIATSMENLIHCLKDILLRQNSNAKILLVSPVPLHDGALTDPHLDQESINKSKQLAAFYKEAALKESVFFLDAGEFDVALGEDGCHLSEAGHRKFSEVMFEEIQRILNIS
jgi:lysophospholipase L1-like esterase